MILAKKASLISRSIVSDGRPYNDYRKELRLDFIYSCAYCTICESEASAIRFTIDHYEPRSDRADLTDEYSNLMWCCDECNTRKGDRVPSISARAAGIRFYRPDQDNFDDHFERNGVRLESLTSIGEYTENALDLNRGTLRRLRDLRTRLYACAGFAEKGVQALKEFKVDALPPSIKAKAAHHINVAGKVFDRAAHDLDQILAAYARSPLDAGEESVEHRQKRAEALKSMEVMYPGAWRARQN